MRKLLAKLNFIKNEITEIKNEILKLHPEDQNEIWDMYQKTYKDIGTHLNKEQLFDQYDGWIMVDHDEDPYADVARSFTQTPYGKKFGISSNDGSEISKKIQKDTVGKFLNTPGYYSELSYTMEYVAQNRNVPYIDNHELVEKILNKTVIWEGDGYYTRNLSGLGKVTKRLYGHPINVDQKLLRKSFKYKGEIRPHA